MASLTFASPAFDDGDRIPKRFTCDGADASPPLSITGVPDEAAALAVTVADESISNGPFVHWLLWNLPPETETVPADVAPVGKIAGMDDAYQGTNGFGDVGYRGPCPSKVEDEHGYRFTLHALAAPLDADGGATWPELADDLRANSLASARFVGRY